MADRVARGGGWRKGLLYNINSYYFDYSSKYIQGWVQFTQEKNK